MRTNKYFKSTSLVVMLTRVAATFGSQVVWAWKEAAQAEKPSCSLTVQDSIATEWEFILS